MRPPSDRSPAAAAGAPWNLKDYFLEAVRHRGGFANHHAHFDKAYLIDPDGLRLTQSRLEEKWKLIRRFKENYTHQDLVARISRCVDNMMSQGVSYCRTMVDADALVGQGPIRAAKEVQSRYAGRIRFEIGVQPLEGVLDPAAFEQYAQACTQADYCGGLPSRDHPREAEHLDVILGLAKELGKPIDIHIDQANSPNETETELLADKILEHGMQGRVFAVHATSLAAKPEAEQDRLIGRIVQADMGIIVCPSAAISTRMLPLVAPLHNAIAPYVKLRAAGVRCYLGTDNIHDLFMPIADGDLWIECRMLMEACRFYDLDALVDFACAEPLAV